MYLKSRKESLSFTQPIPGRDLGRLQSPYPGSTLSESAVTQYLQHSGPQLICSSQDSCAQLQAARLQLTAASSKRLTLQGQQPASGPTQRPMEEEVFYSLQCPVLPNVADGTADTKQNWLGLEAVPNIYISNLPLAAVTMATRSPSNKAAEC